MKFILPLPTNSKLLFAQELNSLVIHILSADTLLPVLTDQNSAAKIKINLVCFISPNHILVAQTDRHALKKTLWAFDCNTLKMVD